MHCSFFIQQCLFCLHGWHQWFLLYVASCSLGAFAVNNRLHCIRMFPDSVFLTSNRLPLALHSVYALRLLPFFIFWHCVLLLICCSSSRIGFQQQDISFTRTSLVHNLRCICAHTKVFSFSSRSASTIVPHCSFSCCSSSIAARLRQLLQYFSCYIPHS